MKLSSFCGDQTLTLVASAVCESGSRNWSKIGDTGSALNRSSL